MTVDEYRKIINSLQHEVRILARELYGGPDAQGGHTAIKTIDRMMDELERLRADPEVTR